VKDLVTSKTRKKTVSRLPRNFHKSFIPERRFIHALLRFAAGRGTGTIQDIANATGIPTGVSSGKVAPTIDYCRAMGLLTLPEVRSAIKKPELTAFGRVVLLEDPYLKTEITQWLAHLNLCGEENGAEVWYQTFWNGAARLGPVFERDSLENWLASVCNTRPGGLIGPLISMYQEDASFAICGALTENGKQVTRRQMAIRSEFAWGYSAWLLSAMERIVPQGEQVTIPQIEKACGWRILTDWTSADSERALSLIERKGAISIDRHMQPWILRAKEPATEAWRFLFSDMI